MVSLLVIGLLFSPREFWAVFSGGALPTFGAFSFFGWISIGLPLTAVGFVEGWHIERVRMLFTGVGGALLAMALIQVFFGGFVSVVFFAIALIHGACSAMAYRELAVRWKLGTPPVE